LRHREKLQQQLAVVVTVKYVVICLINKYREVGEGRGVEEEGRKGR